MVAPKLHAQGAQDAVSYFASPARSESDELRRLVSLIAQDQILSTLLVGLGTLIVVLDRCREIVGANDAFLRAAGATSLYAVLGLRPGEAIGCAHAYDNLGGCGTSRTCASCGAAIAAVLSQSSGLPQERECVISLDRGGRSEEIDFVVRAVPFRVSNEDFLLVSLRDVGEEKRRAAFERVFLHDLAGPLTVLGLALDRCGDAGDGAEREHWILRARDAARQVADEVALQRALVSAGADGHVLRIERVALRPFLSRLRESLEAHPAAAGRMILGFEADDDDAVETDPSVLRRVLANMAVNALEATPAGGTVRLTVERDRGALGFSVWNAGVIPPSLKGRIFQRYFSTKSGSGRGFGTYSMRVFGEQWLGGEVDFVSEPEVGTVFTFRLPHERRHH